jgi:hypothetical protein
VRLLAYLRSADVALNALGLVLGVGLAAAMLLKAADWPTQRTWEPWSLPFVALLVAAVYVPLFSFYKYLDTRQAREEVWRRDVSVTCQEIAWEIDKTCPTVSVGALAVSFWRCRKDGTFDRRARFLLSGTRQSSGLEWRKGRGVAGWLWDRERESAIIEKLGPRNEMTQEEFERLPEQERLGLTYVEWQDVSRYTGVAAVREYERSRDEKRLVGILVIDYVGTMERDADGRDQMDQIRHVLLRDDRLARLRGVLVERLKTRV